MGTCSYGDKCRYRHVNDLAAAKRLLVDGLISETDYNKMESALAKSTATAAPSTKVNDLAAVKPLLEEGKISETVLSRWNLRLPRALLLPRPPPR